MHALAAINPDTGQSILLISLLAPANHHDSNFILPLINLGKAIGLDLKVITGDEAYHDKDGEILKQTGVCVIAPPNQKVALSENVEPGTLQVVCDDYCEIAMEYAGSDLQGHEFKCAAEPGQCPRALICPRYRRIGFCNSGYFTCRDGQHEKEHKTKAIATAAFSCRLNTGYEVEKETN